MRLTKYNNKNLEKQKKIKEKNNTPINYRTEEIFSSDEINIKQKRYIINKDKTKILNKRSPNLIYNKIKQQYTPIRKEILFNQIKNKLIKEDQPINEDKFLKDNNIIFSNKKKNSDLSPSSSYLIKNRSHYISPQREIDLVYIKEDNATCNNNNYYNNNFYKINNTQSNFFIGKILKPKNNFFHNIKLSNKKNIRDISPQSDCLLDNNTYNKSDIYNKTEDNFYKFKKIIKSNNYGKNNRINDAKINRYNNHKVTEIFYTRKNNSNLQNEENNESSDIYVDLYDNNSFFYRPKHNNELTNSKIYNDRINYNNNSNKKKNIIRIQQKSNELMNDLNNKIDDIEIYKNKYPKKNKTELFSDYNPKNNKYSIIKRNNNFAHNNNNLTEIFDSNNYNKDAIFQRKPIINNNKNENKEELSLNRIIVKKRPLKENSISNNNAINEYKKVKYKNFGKGKKFEICKNISFNYENKSDKIYFDNEDSILEYINKKYEEDKQKTYFNRKIKFTGFILTKKYKGKTLYDIRIEDDINKINSKLKEEKVEVNHELIQISFANKNIEENEFKNKINNLEKELSKYKEENDLLSKKDNLKNELIKKLDKEKQNLCEEIKRLNNEIEKLKKININLNNKLLKAKNEIHSKNYEIKNISSIFIEKGKKEKIFDTKNLTEGKMEIYYISKNIDNSNILSINNNLSNGDIENESKKNILFRLSKISDIKENKLEHNDSKDTIIKKNIDLLNNKLNNIENYDKDIEE